MDGRRPGCQGNVASAGRGGMGTQGEGGYTSKTGECRMAAAKAVHRQRQRAQVRAVRAVLQGAVLGEELWRAAITRTTSALAARSAVPRSRGKAVDRFLGRAKVGTVQAGRLGEGGARKVAVVRALPTSSPQEGVTTVVRARHEMAEETCPKQVRVCYARSKRQGAQRSCRCGAETAACMAPPAWLFSCVRE